MSFSSAVLLAAAVAADQSAPPPDAAALAVAPDKADILVTATRLALPIDRIAPALTVLDKAAIDRSQDLGVTELLLRTPGVSVSRNGGYGAATSLRIRGAEEEEEEEDVEEGERAQPGRGHDEDR